MAARKIPKALVEFGQVLVALFEFSHRHTLLVAGEPEWDARQSRTAAGGVMVPPALLKDMKDLREYLPGIREKYPQFPFETEEDGGTH